MKTESTAPSGFQALVDAAGAAINSIKINGVSAGQHRGHPVRIKTRLQGSESIAGLANLFFKMCDAHITVLADPKEWQRWEIVCYQLLNGDQFQAFAKGSRTVCQETVPGRNLRDLLKSGSLCRPALEAAAREIRRAHLLPCREYDGPWSHGDMHMGNVIYDESSNRARLIDFEIVHNKSWETRTRHADDLLVFLQDLVGRVTGRQWLPLSFCFLQAYGRPRVIGRLRTLLEIPKGIPGIWWEIRSHYCEGAKLRRRIKALAHALDAWAKADDRTPRSPTAVRHTAPTLAERVQ